MKNRAIIPLVVGLAVGLVAVKLSVDVVKKAHAANGNDDMCNVVVAQQMIPMGMEIKPGMLGVSKTSKPLAPQGAFADPKKLSGRVVRTQIPKGVPVIEEMLAAPGTPAGMASLVPAGFRAVAVKVDEDSSVAGFLKPGCRVDVAAVLNVRCANGPSSTISKVILQDVMVGAVGQNLTGEGDSTATLSRSVTLLVKPEEVAVLHLAASQGRVRLAMRHYEDVGASARASVARETELDPDAPQNQKKEEGKGGFLDGLAKLFQGEQKVATEAPKPAWAQQMVQRDEASPAHVVTLFNGGSVENLAFENGHSLRRVANTSSGRVRDLLAAAGRAEPQPGRVAQQAPQDDETPAEQEPTIAGERQPE